MFSTKILGLTAALMLLLAAVESSSSSGGGGCSVGRNCNYDISNRAELTQLYNSGVYLAERMKRPFDNWPFMLGPLSHSGVRVTLADGSQWLIHKGDDYGISSQTVVVNARHMSSKWKVVKTKNFEGTKTVADFVAAGGSDYNLIFDNCHLGSRRMMNQ